MRLNSLHLTNFRQHVDTHIDFELGITGIIGPNGSGKSTILEAIAWALYGMPAARGTRDSIRSYRAAPRAQVKVELDFELAGHRYFISRGLNDAELYLDGANALIDLGHRKPSGDNPLEIDQRPRGRKLVEGVRACDQVALDEPFSLHAGHRLLIELAPRVRARVIDRAAVKHVRLDLAVHVVVAERDVVPAGGADFLFGDLDGSAIGVKRSSPKQRGCAPRCPIPTP